MLAERKATNPAKKVNDFHFFFLSLNSDTVYVIPDKSRHTISILPPQPNVAISVVQPIKKQTPKTNIIHNMLIAIS